METWEEINRVTESDGRNVENFGWPCYEGAGARQSGYDAANIPICENLYAPATERDGALLRLQPRRTGGLGRGLPSGGSSISGLAFYEGGSYPDNYDGALFFSDYSRGCIWVMFPGGNGLPDPNNRATFVDRSPTVKDVGPTDLEIGPAGDLFYPDYDHGTIRRIQYVAEPPPPPTSGLVAAWASTRAPARASRTPPGAATPERSGRRPGRRSGKYGNALSFNGSNARVTCPTRPRSICERG